MAGDFLRRWLRRGKAVSPDVRAALDELSRLEQDRPALSGLIHLLARILPELYGEPIREVPPDVTREQARAASAPLLRGQQLRLDKPAFRRRWDGICKAVEEQRGDKAGATLAAALRDGRLDSQQLLEAVLSGRTGDVLAQAEVLGLDAALTGSVLRLALFPILAHLSAELAPLRAGLSWEHGSCPVCGGWPLLGEYRGLEQTRFLRCALCAAAWEFPRLACPYCEAREHRLLGYFHVEGEESSPRAATCEGCHGYVKMLATLTELSGPRLLVADLATTHLDLAAGERGYVRPSR